MNIIDVQELTKVYQGGMKKRGIVALDNVSLSIGEGEIFGLLGPNGAGKTTLFKILLNITQPSSGSCMVSGIPPHDPRSREKVGFLPENHRFPDHLTGIGLLELTARMHNAYSPEIDREIDRLLDLVGMEKWGGTRIGKYSKGMMQRIGLAQALVGDPDILMLDEPTDGVDPVGKIEIRKVLEKIREEGKSVVLNSHLLSEVESVADRVAILNKGKIVRVGTVDELTSRKSHYEIEANFGHVLIDIPEELGKKISLSTQRLIVELTEEENINAIIDMLRVKKISLRSVKPLRISLEQSFIETVTAGEGL